MPHTRSLQWTPPPLPPSAFRRPPSPSRHGVVPASGESRDHGPLRLGLGLAANVRAGPALRPRKPPAPPYAYLARVGIRAQQTVKSLFLAGGRCLV